MLIRLVTCRVEWRPQPNCSPVHRFPAPHSTITLQWWNHTLRSIFSVLQCRRRRHCLLLPITRTWSAWWVWCSISRHHQWLTSHCVLMLCALFCLPFSSFLIYFIICSIAHKLPFPPRRMKRKTMVKNGSRRQVSTVSCQMASLQLITQSTTLPAWPPPRGVPLRTVRCMSQRALLLSWPLHRVS